ncbi:pickpocket protein 28-like [Culicoides brevitarsis]|uniref:pickpocket protein 28-like n=1 Tax=Culicoides brevitarsis TaxID=469753 RepID=UPI00307BE525
MPLLSELTIPKKRKSKPHRYQKKKIDIIEEHFDDYFVNTTLHGLKYVGMTNLSIIERLFFLVSFIFVVCLSGYFITNVYMKWVRTPIIISLDPQLSQSKDFPFPAVTICNMNQARNTFAKNISRDSIEYAVLTSMCHHTKLDSTFKDNIFGKWSYVRKLILNITQPCSQLLTSCRFSGRSIDCNKIFRTILTDEGLCCTFNSLDSAYMFSRFSENNNFDSGVPRSSVFWSPETKYNNQVFDETPRRNPGAGVHMGLSIMLNLDFDEYFCSSSNSYGFKVLLHNPAETPKISNFGLLLSAGMETRLLFSPVWYSASPSIKDIHQNVRQCIFENESKLDFFRVYTKQNCEMECEASITEQECKCRALHMPKLNDEVRICDQRDSAYRTEYFGDDSLLCECLPACYEISYSTEMSSAPLLRNNMFDGDAILDLKNTGILHVFLEDASFRSFTKTEFIGFTEFLSNTGGLLGLFMGFSVLSVVEIIYFSSMRPYYMHKKEKELLRKAATLVSKSEIVELSE